MDSRRRSTAYAAMFGSATGPLEHGPRDELDTSIRGHTAHQAFTKALFVTNRRLGVHGEQSLQQADADRYKDIARRVEKGDLSNSYAFASSSIHWARQGNWLGAVMNAAGFLAAGSIDAANYKRGRRF